MARNVEIIISIDDRGSASIKRLRRTTVTESQKMKRAAEKNFAAMRRSLSGNLDSMTNRFLMFAKFGVAIFGTIAAGAVVKFGSTFEKTMSGVRAVTQGTERDMQVLTDQARELGATTVFTAVQASEAMEELGKAGFTTTEIFGVMPDVLNLAAAGTLEMAEAAGIASNVIRIMGLDITEFKDATDIMVTTAINAKTTVSELGFAYQDAAPLARSLGITFKDLNVLMATLANRGFVATRSGTALRRIFSVFLGDLEEGEKGLAAYNVQLARNDDGTVNLIDTFQQLVDAGLDANDVMEAFGLRGGPAALNIISSLGLEVDGLNAKLNDFAGKAGQVATTRLDNLAGDGKILLSTMQELALVFFDQVGPGLREIAQGATTAFREWQKLVKASDVVGGLTTLFQVGKVAAIAYGIAIGFGLVQKIAGFVFSMGTGIASMLTMNATMLASIPIIHLWTTATIAARVAMGVVGLAVGALAFIVGKALLKMTGLAAAFDTEANRAAAAAVATDGLAEAIAGVRGEIDAINEVTPKGGILEGIVEGLVDDLRTAEGALADLGGETQSFLDLSTELAAKASAERKLAWQSSLAGRGARERAVAEQVAAAWNKQAEVQSASLKILRIEYEKLTAFVLEASDEQKRAFVSAWEEAGFGAAQTADQIALAFEIMAERTKAASQKTAEDLRGIAEAEKELARQQKNLIETFEAAELASTEMGEALVAEVLQAMKDFEATGKDTDVVLQAFSDTVQEMIERIRRAGEEVPTALFRIGTAALKLAQDAQDMLNLGASPGGLFPGQTAPDDDEPFDPTFGGAFDPEDAIDTEGKQGIEPPDPQLWMDFFDTIENRAQEFVDTAGEAFGMFAQQAISGVGNIVGAFISGTASIKDTQAALFKSLVAGMVSHLVQWGIQRLILGKVIQKQGASESVQALSSGVALTGVNFMASMGLAPFPINLSAPAVASAMTTIAAGFAALAAGGVSASVAGGGQEGGIIKRRSFIEVGEGSQEEAIIPLRGGHADRVRKELFRDVEMGSTIIVNNNFIGDNWRDSGIDDELGEMILESLDGLINRGRDFELSTETRG